MSLVIRHTDYMTTTQTPTTTTFAQDLGTLMAKWNEGIEMAKSLGMTAEQAEAAVDAAFRARYIKA
jgi:hypothetical protein